MSTRLNRAVIFAPYDIIIETEGNVTGGRVSEGRGGSVGFVAVYFGGTDRSNGGGGCCGAVGCSVGGCIGGADGNSWPAGGLPGAEGCIDIPGDHGEAGQTCADGACVGADCNGGTAGGTACEDKPVCDGGTDGRAGPDAWSAGCRIKPCPGDPWH